MLSKEEIEKAKIKLQEIKEFWLKYDYATDEGKKNLLVNANVIETLLQYIQELEQSNKYLDRENNRLEKIEFEKDMANKMIDEMAKYISKISDCPLEVYDVDLECDKECGKISEQECWRKYYKQKVEGENNGN